MSDPRPIAAEAVEAAPERVRVLLAVLLVTVTVTVINNSMVLVLIPEIGRDFAASAASLGWVVTAFSLAFAVATPLYGRVADVFGIRRVFVAGLVVFIAGSLLAGLAPGIGVHLAGRVLQGLGSAAVPALGSVAVARALPPGRRGVGFGVIATGVGAGQALGPPLAGLVAQAAGWTWPFLGAALLVAPVLVFAPRVLPDGQPVADASWRRVDLLGGALLATAVGLALLGVTRGQLAGFGSVSCWGSILVALVLAGAFVLRIRRARAPFAPPTLFTHAPFVIAVGVGFLTLFCYLGMILLVPLLVATVNGLAVGQVGLILLPGALAVAALSSVFGRLSDRVGPRLLVVTGLAVLAVAALALSTTAGAPALVVGTITTAVGLGLAMITSPLINAVSAAVPEEHAGVGLGLYQGAFFLGGGTGAAVVGAVLADRFGATGSWNPLHDGLGAPFSDALLVVAGVLVLALVPARRLPGGCPVRLRRARGDRESAR